MRTLKNGGMPRLERWQETRNMWMDGWMDGYKPNPGGWATRFATLLMSCLPISIGFKVYQSINHITRRL